MCTSGKEPANGERAPAPTPTVNTKDYGNRPDGSKKGSGWLGEIPMQDGSGRVMTEQTAEVDTANGRLQFPLIHPGSTKEELDHLARGGKPTREMLDRAIEHARERQKQGLSPYKD